MDKDQEYVPLSVTRTMRVSSSRNFRSTRVREPRSMQQEVGGKLLLMPLTILIPAEKMRTEYCQHVLKEVT